MSKWTPSPERQAQINENIRRDAEKRKASEVIRLQRMQEREQLDAQHRANMEAEHAARTARAETNIFGAVSVFYEDTSDIVAIKRVLHLMPGNAYSNAIISDFTDVLMAIENAVGNGLSVAKFQSQLPSERDVHKAIKTAFNKF